MRTVILKWNPNFSSYNMYHYLYDMVNCNYGADFDYNWSVWEYDKIHEGEGHLYVCRNCKELFGVYENGQRQNKHVGCDDVVCKTCGCKMERWDKSNGCPECGGKLKESGNAICVD